MADRSNGKKVTTIEGLDPRREPPGAARPGARSTCRSAATARPARSCRPLALLKQTPKPTDAEIDSAMYRQHLPLRNLSAHSRRHQASRGSVTMTKHIREMASASGIENVSRRGVLKGILSLAGLVLAVARHAVAVRRWPTRAPKWGADGMPHGTVDNPLAFVVDRARRHRHHRLPSLRDGTGRTHRHAADRGRRAGGRLGPGEGGPGAGRRGQVRQSGHRRLAVDPRISSCRCAGAAPPPADAGGGRSETLGRGHLRRRGEEPRGHPEVDRQDARLWRARRRRQHDGRPVECQPRKTGAATPVSLPLKDPSEFRYIGKEGTNIVDGFDITTGRAIMARTSACPGRSTPSSRARR